jgi:acyl carrier protein
VPRGNQVPSTGELRSFLKEKLPDPMVPAAFVGLPALPRLPNGKVDRGALPALDSASWHGGTGAFIAPRTGVEELVAKIWGEVLGVERIGIHDNFFELGGHSLLATRVISRLNEVLDVSVPLRSMFDAPTVAELCSSLVQGQARDINPD